MDIFGVLSFVGGLAMFLYGMSAMGDGLTKLSGGKLEYLLEKLTSKRIMAVLLGAGVTAVIQSSSATTVMVVGFVNSGIMKLNQAVGIIMGANIGTTITSWILSLTGIQGDNVFIKMLNPSSFSPILAIIGVFMLMLAKSDKKKNVGTLLTGFSILMFGMHTMSSAVSPLADVPEFTGLLVKFSIPVLGVLAGTILTAVIQSSSASVGILQALCATGSVSYAVAIPIIMGQNIGTCITALLSSIGTSRNARRTAMVHLYFNIIGTVLFLVLFYGINAFVHFPFLETSANAAGIAIVHSGFNIFATLILFPFADGLVKLAKLTIPDGPEEKADEAVQMLDTRFLDSPAFALQQCKVAAAKMAELTETGLVTSVDLMASYNEADAENVDILEKKVDHFEDALGTYLVKLSSEKLSPKDSQTLSMILHCIGDFERISDHARNIKEAAQEMHDKQLVFSEKAQEELKVFERAVHDVLDLTMTSFKNGNLNLARQVEPLEEVIDGLSLDVKQRHVRRLRKGKCTIELGFILSDVITNFERVSEHCSNIAVCLVQVNEDEFDTHAYLDELRQEDNKDFQSKVLACREKYQLPPTKQERLAEKNAKLLAE